MAQAIADEARGGRPRAGRRAEIVGRLGPAIERRLERGETYSELSVSTLAEDAGTSRTRFYVHFEDKGDLLRALTQDVITDLLTATVEWWSLPRGAAREQLRGVTARIFATYLDHRHLLAAVEQVATHDSAMREHFVTLFNQALEVYAEQIERGQRDGVLDPALDPYLTAQLLSSMTQSGLYQIAPGAPGAELEAWIDSLTAIVWNILYEPGTDGARDA